MVGQPEHRTLMESLQSPAVIVWDVQTCDPVVLGDRALKAGMNAPPPWDVHEASASRAGARVTEDRCQILRALVLVVASFVPLDHSVEVKLSKLKSSVTARTTASASSSRHGLDGLILFRPDSMSLDEFDIAQSSTSQRSNTIL